MSDGDWSKQEVKLRQIVQGYRPGWRGVYNHAVNVLTGRRNTIDVDHVITLSFQMKGPDNVQFTGFNLEVHN